MRLIDADALTFYVRQHWGELYPKDRAMIDAILVAPTVDAIEVVRCKDCKYYLNSNEKCGLVDTRLLFYETDKVWTEDSFCSWGEKENVDN